MSIDSIQLRIALQANLKTAQNYNESILTTVPLGLVTLTEDGEICSPNPAFSEFFLCPDPEGFSIYDLFYNEETCHEIRSAMQGVREEDSEPREFEFSTGSEEEEGERHFHFHIKGLKISTSEFEAHHAPGDEGNSQARFLVTIEEISDRVKLLHGLQANLRVLKDTRDQLVDAEKLSAVGKLAAGVAHEMNNPLTAVLTYSSLLIDKLRAMPEDLQERLPRFEERLVRMKEAATVCKSIADNLLSFSRQSREEKIAVSIAETLRLTQGLIHMHLTKSQVQLEIDMPAPPPRVLTNPAELQQVFTNLIVNAIQAIGSGGKIVVKGREQDGRCLIEVSDNGPGIPAEIQQKIFDPFFTTKPLGEGTGLGLSIVYGIIQNLSGTIEIDSTMGVGTTFRISLPLLIEKDEAS